MTKSNKAAIVIGSTGLVGTELVRQLLDDPNYDQIITFARSQSRINSPKLIQHIVDFDDISSWQHLMQGQALFCCLGTTLKQAGSKAAQAKIDLDYPRNLAQIAAQNGVKKAVLVSSTGANPNSNSFYLALKGRLEQSFIDCAFEQLVIVRPSVLKGKRRELRIGEKLSEILLSTFSFLPWIKRYRPISGTQVAHSMRFFIANTAKNKVQLHELDELFFDQ